MTLSPGMKLGPYEIVAAIGLGGMGEVYRARDSRLGREVAVKVLPTIFSSDADRLARFQQEARATGLLNHPNILAIYDVGTSESAPYLVSELLEGETLRDKLRNGALPARKAIEYAIQISRGLAAAHEKGIVHRDLKPENLFITKDGRVKILDFGLAKLTGIEDAGDHPGQDVTLTLPTDPGIVMGTVGYMSPEQARGKTADERSDLFSLGAILYEMLSGKRAFQRETSADTISAILKEDPPEIVHLAQRVSPAIERVLRRCLEKETGERFQSARDLGFALEAIGDSSSGGIAIREGVLGRSRTKRRAAAGIIFAFAILAAYFAGRKTHVQTATTQPTYQALTFRRGTVTAARFAPDGQTVVYAAAWEGMPNRLYMARTDSPESRPLDLEHGSLFAISPLGEMAVSVGCKEYFLAACGGTLGRMPLSGGAPRPVIGRVSSADFLPDGKELAVAREVGGHYRVEFPIGNVIYETTDWISSMRVSPGGDLVAFARNSSGGDFGTVVVLDRQGRKRTEAGPNSSLEGVSWSPSGKEVLFAASQGSESWADQIRAVDLTGRQRMLLRLPGIIRLHDVFRDGRLLISREDWRARLNFRGPGDSNERDLSWLDLSIISDLSRTGDSVLSFEPGEATGNMAYVYLRKADGSPPVRLGEGAFGALSPDEKWVLVITSETTEQLGLLPTGTGEMRRLENYGIQRHLQPGWAPNGKEIAFAGHDGTGWHMFVQKLTGEKPRPITPEITPPSNSAGGLSPDGKFVFARDLGGKAWLYAVDGSEPRPISGLAADDAWAGWGTDSSFAYFYSPNRPVRIFRLNLNTGEKKPIAELVTADPTGIAEIRSLRITPDGKAYGYSYERALSELYMVSSLQ